MLRTRSNKQYSTLKAKPYHSVSTRAGKIALLDSLVRQIVNLRDKCCITCGSIYQPECSHFYKRRFHATRWDLRNCNRQCRTCNNLHNINPFPYMKAMQERYGADEVVKLLELRDSKKHFSDAELDELIVERRAELRTLRAAA